VKPLGLIVRETWGDVVDRRLFHLLPLWCIGVLLAMPLAASLTLGDPHRGLLDLGMTAQWLTCSAIAVWLGLSAVGTALEDGRAALTLARPVSAATWLAGRTLGAGSVLTLFILGTEIGWVGAAVFHGLDPHPDLLWGPVLLLGECTVLTTLAMGLSSAMRSTPAGACAIGLWIAGHLADEYGAVSGASVVVFSLVPSLDAFDAQTPLVTGRGIQALAAGRAMAYSMLWSAAAVALTLMMVRRRDTA